MDVSYGAFTLNGSPIQVTKALSTSTNLTTDGFVHMLAYTNPSDVTTASTIFTDYVQIVVEYKAIDSVEYFTSNSVEIEVKQLNKASAYLVEVDMNAVCTALYGGNNTNLKNALNSISVDAWVMGQGSDGGNLRNNVRIMAWRASDSTYAYSYIAENITPNVTKCTIPSSTPTDYIGWSKDRVTSNNKIYILAHSLYTSDTFIPSEVNLDYINVRVDLSGQPDVVQSIPLTLPDTWSMIVKGWSPSYPYDSYSSGYSSIVQLYRDSNNYLHLAYDKSSKNFYFHAVQRGINTHLMQTVKSTTFSKYQCTNFAVVTNSANTIIYALENGEPIASVSLAKFNTLGVFQLYFGSHQSGNYQADAFLQSLQFYPNKIFSDTDAEAMLRSMPELIDLSKATLYNGATYSNGIITHTNSTSGSQLAFIMVIPVLPNNNYVITCDDLTNGYIDVIERYNNVSISNHWGYVTPTTKTNSVIVTDKTNNLYVMVVNGNNQTSSYSKLSVKIKM
jgi:hypothetical protein